MRRAFDLLTAGCHRPAFLMNVPNTWQSVAAQRLYRDELNRLGDFLVELGGSAPSRARLQAVMIDYDDARAALRAAQSSLAPARFVEAAVALDRCADILDAPNTPHTTGVPIAIIGGPLLGKDRAIYKMICASGGRIALDATETGERGLCPPFDRRALRDDPFAELADAYFNGIHDASRRPNSELYVWLKTQLSERNVRGIVFHRYIWCDIWHAELRRLQDWAGVPVLEIDAEDGGTTSCERTQTRIGAFLEMLR
jgi:benzoyl-CoA reductase/2-hydroxyglutaryl-CoA dehydratase subunit BcrC/BadD/HgdB